MSKLCNNIKSGALMNDLLAFTIEAHGGLERWERVVRIRMRGQMGGLGLLHSDYDSEPVRTADIMVGRPMVSVNDFPEPGERTDGVFADKLVEIKRAEGSNILNQRKNPRDAFLYYPARFKRWFWYDTLDVTYFLGYALWNYFHAPFLFVQAGFETEEGEPVHVAGRKMRQLIVKFPPDIPTHSRVQRFFINDKGLVNYFTYTVDIVGPWALAIHYCRSYRDFSGFKVATRRRALLRYDHCLRHLRVRKNLATLMWGNMHDVEYITREQ